MNNGANSFKVGLFVLSSAGVLLLGVVVFTAGELAYERVIVETYLDHSVQGLELGSPVLFRGVEIGRVETINFTRNHYEGDLPIERRQRWVLVELSLHPKTISSRSDEEIRSYLNSEIERGMRIQMVSAGFTGKSFLETDYHPPQEIQDISLPWSPKQYYIPSIPMQKISSAVRELETSVQRIEADIHETSQEVIKAIKDATIADVRAQLMELMAGLKETNAELRAVVDRREWLRVRADVAETAQATKKLVAKMDPQLTTLLDKLHQNADGVEEVRKKVVALLDDESFKTIRENLAEGSADAKVSAAQLSALLLRVDRSLVVQLRDLQRLVSDARQASENVRDLSDTLKEYPSQLLFGLPPTPDAKKEPKE